MWNRTLSLWLPLAAAALCLAPAASAVVTIDWVAIGNPGNPADTSTNCIFSAADCGSVAYAYRISKYEVTNAQYVEFLNAVADTDTNGLYHPSMELDARGGITRSGASGSYTYAVKSGRGNNPVVWVNWYDAARFTNWLHNGQPTGAQGVGTTEGGAYTLMSPMTILGGRQVGALTFLPTENEWYKAAFYDAATTSFFDFPTGSNTKPSNDVPPGGPNSANFYDFVNGTFALTGSGTYNPAFNYLTDVGAYTGSASPSGTFDQAGNVREWNETAASGGGRGLRDGSWLDDGFGAAATGYVLPSGESDYTGFRVATLVGAPPPAVPIGDVAGPVVAALLVMTGLLGLAYRQRRYGRVA